ncbi:hypothetical protein N657DRAFT_616888 [Parathielavia appendiculata]|uniref:Mtf2-like C-terminal domain-containing protein n=1 Tax=Parathielavia appendiculata TaxID=2587402 RepID=A0AAN6U0K3_9PEZI|nr:hypothetical protein N657DRAFT_616888 [Parathielavia appendiculata]
MATLLPFLYQTRTLQRLSRTGLSTPAFRALLHSTTRANSPRYRPGQQKSQSNDIPFELPEGYEDPDKKSDTEPFDESGVPSTITPAEQDVFSRIFEEIAARNKKGASAVAQPSPVPPINNVASTAEEHSESFSHLRPFSEVDGLESGTKEQSSNLLRSTVEIIVQDAAEAQSNARRQIQKPFVPLHPLEQTKSATEWEKALLRFPPSLRNAARMALGAIEAGKEAEGFADTAAGRNESMSEEQRSSAEVDFDLNPLAKSVQNEALRREERNRVDAKLRAAKTDFEVWDVLEEEVFPMVRKLGIDEDPSKADPNPKRGSKRKTNKPQLALHIYGPLYPAYLLNALRILDTQFARSSPLALQILPRVKELGPASFVLGVSTPFYNELARILWSRYGDPTAVFNLLEEMRMAGLYCDEGTRSVVQQIEQFLASVSQGNWGPFLRELASLPEYEFAILPRIRHWLKTINVHIYERKNELQEVA